MTRSMILWCLPALLVMTGGVVQAEGEGPVCLNIPVEKMAKLRDLVVKEDVHDKLIGNFTLLWVSRGFLDQGENSCDMYTRTKVDDRVLRVGAPSHNMTLNLMEKVENGIYLMQSEGNAKTLGKFHIVYADNRTLAFFFCLLEPMSPGDESATNTSLWTGLNVRTKDLRTELDPDTQTVVERAVTRVREHQDLLGEIVFKPLAC